ncbi:MAG: bifunctional 4-hydroxy-2-oxoglutarate aldolase/2-dehydro-3-deoxy-phosphogluconate aldolase [Spirochaetaceae bacterium]
MNVGELHDTLADLRLVPVIALNDENSAVPLGEALLDGGLPLAEITFRTAAAESSIRRLAKELPDLLLGAGTVLTTEQVDRASEAGASFVVTPGFNPRVVEYALKREIPIIPGVNNPTGVEQGLELGLSLLKFFPAEASGGVRMLEALKGPYPSVSFLPTGGVSEKNLDSYLSLANVLAVGGSWVVPKSAIEEEDFAHIRELTAEACELLGRL